MSAPAAHELAELRDELRAVARRALAPHGPGADDPQPVPWALLRDAGWLGLEVPEALGGAGATLAEAVVVAEELGRVCAAGPALGTAPLGVGALLLTEPSPRRDELLAGVAAGEVRLAVVGLDPEAGGRPFRVEGGRLSGAAASVLDGPDADHLLVLAEGDGGPVLVVLTAATGGLAVTDDPVLDATRRLAAVEATEVPVDHDAVLVLGADGAPALLARAAVALAADGLGLCEAMVEATVAYAGQRVQFGRPIGSFQAVKHACADMRVATTVARELLGAAVDALGAGDPEGPRLASMAKAHVGDVAVDVVGTALQLHGGIGYTWESGIHRYLKRALLDRSLFGAPAWHRRQVAAAYPTS